MEGEAKKDDGQGEGGGGRRAKHNTHTHTHAPRTNFRVSFVCLFLCFCFVLLVCCCCFCVFFVVFVDVIFFIFFIFLFLGGWGCMCFLFLFFVLAVYLLFKLFLNLNYQIPIRLFAESVVHKTVTSLFDTPMAGPFFRERHTQRDRQTHRDRTTVQTCPVSIETFNQIVAHERFVKACPAGWIPTTLYLLHIGLCVSLWARHGVRYFFRLFSRNITGDIVTG